MKGSLPMTPRVGLLLSLLAGPLFAADTAPAQAYISDQLTVGLRAGAAKEQKIINYAQAGEAVQILDRAPGTGFFRVRAASGPEGWLEAERVVSSAPAVARFAELQQKYASVVAELDDMKLSLQDRSSLQQRVDQLQAQVVALENQNEKLTQENMLLSQRDRSSLLWAGSLIIAVGVVLGWVLAAFKPRRKDGWR